jgi:hypothetical protein
MPDIALRAIDVDPPRFFFTDESEAEIMVTVKVKNVGQSTARKSVGALKLRETTGERVRVEVTPRFRISALRPGKSRSRNLFVGVDQLPGLGRYEVEGCADHRQRQRERREANNCRTGRALSVIPRQWSGEVRGSFRSVPGVTESWTAHVQFVYEPSSDSTEFSYSVSGWIEFTTTGTDELGCTHDGYGTYSISRGDGSLVVLPELTGYRGSGSFEPPEGWRYLIRVRCDRREKYVRTGPDAPTWFATGDQKKDATAASLTGGFTDDAEGAEWSWTLDSA